MKSSPPWIIAAILMAASLPALAGEVKIVANASVKTGSVTVSELRSVFLLQRGTLEDGSAVAPVVQRSGAAHEAFVREYLNRDPEGMRSFYEGMVSTGKGLMPKILGSDQDVVAYVARTRGAIGYVSKVASVEGVKVIEVVPEERKQKRQLLTRVEPEYPEALRERHITGTVKLELEISPQGRVETVVVLGGNPILAEAAVKAAKQWVYAAGPGRKRVQVTIPFEAKQ